MSFDGSGNYTRLYNWTTDKINGIKIQSTRMDAEANDFATAFNQTFLRSGVVALTGNFKAGGNSVTGLAPGAVGTPAIQFSGDATTGLFLPSAGALGFAVGGVERLRLNSNGGYITGSFGLGNITAPRSALDVGGIASFKSSFEDCTVSATAVSGTVQCDFITNPINVYTSNATANFSFNVRGNASTSLDSIMGVGQVMNMTIEVPCGATGYYCTAITVDGGAPSAIKWFNGAPTTGYASAINVYAITVIKTAAATFLVRASLAGAK